MPRNNVPQMKIEILDNDLIGNVINYKKLKFCIKKLNENRSKYKFIIIYIKNFYFFIEKKIFYLLIIF